MPSDWLMISATLVLLSLSVRPLYRIFLGWFGKGDGCGCSTEACSTGNDHGHGHQHAETKAADCGCSDSSCEISDPAHVQPLSALGTGGKNHHGNKVP